MAQRNTNTLTATATARSKMAAGCQLAIDLVLAQFGDGIEDPELLCPAECKPVDDVLVWRIHDCGTGENAYVQILEIHPDMRGIGYGDQWLLKATICASGYDVEQFHSGEWDLDHAHA